MANIFRVLARLCGVAALLVAAPAVPAADPPPLSAYGSLPGVEDMALSHSGKRIAALATIAGERAIVVMDDQLRVVRTMSVADAKLRSMEWIGDDRLLLQISRTEDLGIGFTADQFEAWQAYIVPADSAGEPRLVFAEQASIADAVFGAFGLRSVGGHWTAFFGGIELERGGYANHFRPALFAVDLADNDPRRIAQAPGEDQHADWLLAPDGTIAASFTIDSRNGKWMIKGPHGGVLATGTAPTGDAGLVALGPDGTTAIYEEVDAEASLTQWYEVALDGRSPRRPFLPDEDVDRLFVDRTTGRVLAYLAGGPDGGPRFFAKEHQSVVDRIHRAFPQPDMHLIDWTPDFSRVLVRTSGNADSGTWYLVDMAQLKATGVGFERMAIPPEQVGPISTVEYRAADGLALDGILTLPPGREARNLPLVMLPHGGPHSRDEEAFDWRAQAFASRGYAVFQPNFRGSTNRDEAFERAGYGEWGRKMQSDISDGLAELARRGIVDPTRACIVGASYGGYAALAGVTLQQGLYRCAVAVAGVSDIGLMYSTDYRESGRDGLLRRSLLEELGPRSGFDAVSPRRFARQADAPILLIHGKDDTVVPFEQSSKMADALKDAGKPHELVVLREEDHWMSRADTRLQMLEEAVAFVQQHNPPG